MGVIYGTGIATLEHPRNPNKWSH